MRVAMCPPCESPRVTPPDSVSLRDSVVSLLNAGASPPKRAFPCPESQSKGAFGAAGTLSFPIHLHWNPTTSTRAGAVAAGGRGQNRGNPGNRDGIRRLLSAPPTRKRARKNAPILFRGLAFKRWTTLSFQRHRCWHPRPRHLLRMAKNPPWGSGPRTVQNGEIPQ